MFLTSKVLFTIMVNFLLSEAQVIDILSPREEQCDQYQDPLPV